MARFGLEAQQIGIRLRRLFGRTVLCNVAGLDTSFNSIAVDCWTRIMAMPCRDRPRTQSDSTIIFSEDFESAFYNMTEISIDPMHSAEEIISNMPRVITESYIASAIRSTALHSAAADSIIENSIRQELLASRFLFNVGTGLVEIRTTTNTGDAIHHMKFKLDECLVERKLDEELCVSTIRKDWEKHYV